MQQATEGCPGLSRPGEGCPGLSRPGHPYGR